MPALSLDQNRTVEIMDDVAFNWFWQPPVDGQPGLIMLTDDHPGVDHPEIRFVTEAIADVVRHIEGGIPKYFNLFQFKIYARDIFGRWIHIEVAPIARNYRLRTPKVSQADLASLWDSRNEATLQ